MRRSKSLITWGCLVVLLGVVGWMLYNLYDRYGIPGVLVGSCFLYAVFGFVRWFREVEQKNKTVVPPVKFSDDGCAIVTSDGDISEKGDGLTQSIYPNDSSRWIRDRLDRLEAGKADKDVIKSENRRLMDKVEGVTDEVDDLKARMLAGTSHTCLRGEEIAEMKKICEASNKLAESALDTANLTSARGFKIIMGFIAGMITLGSAAVVWAVNVGRTADDAYARIERIEQDRSVLVMPDSVKSSQRGLNDAQTPANSSQVSVDRLLDKAVSEAIRAALDRAAQTGQFDPPAPPPNPDVFVP